MVKKQVEVQELAPIVAPAIRSPESQAPACIQPGRQIAGECSDLVESNIVKKNDTVLITRKSVLGSHTGNSSPPHLRQGQGQSKSKLQPNRKPSHRKQTGLFPKSNYNRVGWNYDTQDDQP